MRILHLLSQTELTGSEAYAASLAHDQHQKGHAIFVISDTLHLPFPGVSQTMSISTASFWQRMRNILALERFIRDNKIDLVHCHSRGACRHAHWATRRTRTPVVTTLHGYQHVSFSKKLFNIYGDTVITVCEKIRDQLLQDFRVDPASVKVLRNPLSFEWKTPALEQKNIALIGRASGPKGRRLKELFRAEAAGWLEMNAELGIELILPGLSENERGSLLQVIPAKHQGRVRIENHHARLAEVFARSRVVVSSGRIALEAFAAACEVIALGEAKFEGRLGEENLPFQLTTNFGDVGPEQALDPQAVTHEIRKTWRDPLSPRQRERLQAFLAQEFSQQRICDEIEEIYRAARLLKKAPGLPILMYHKIPKQPIPSRHRIFVTAENFEKHLLFFQSRGFQSLTFEDLADFWFERKPLDQFPEKPLMITFDDGYADNLENALPLLERYGMRATLFLLANPDIRQNTWDSEPGLAPAPLMSLEEKKSLPPSLYQIGSHGLDHIDLRKLSDTEILRQMKDSKARLEKDLGRKINAFAAPFGWIDSRFPALAREAGYDFVVNTDRGALRWVDDRFAMFRVNIFPEESWFSLWKKTGVGYRRRYFHKRKQ